MVNYAGNDFFPSLQSKKPDQPILSPNGLRNWSGRSDFAAQIRIFWGCLMGSCCVKEGKGGFCIDSWQVGIALCFEKYLKHTHNGFIAKCWAECDGERCLFLCRAGGLRRLHESFQLANWQYVVPATTHIYPVHHPGRTWATVCKRTRVLFFTKRTLISVL